MDQNMCQDNGIEFDKDISNFGFKDNVEDHCIYAKYKNRIFIFLVLNMDEIILA